MLGMLDKDQAMLQELRRHVRTLLQAVLNAYNTEDEHTEAIDYLTARRIS